MSTKKRVLEKLEMSKGTPISGSVIARSLGVSRNAVWKAVEALREEGHEIRGGSGRGYTLDAGSDRLSGESIRPFLTCDIDLFVHESIDSTNKECKRLAIDEPVRPVLVVANEQTEGRGRLGRTFYSPAETGVYMSFLIRPDFDLNSAMLVTTAASVAAAKAIEEVAKNECRIKWVNDIYANGKKVCGILTEAVAGCENGSLEYIIVGIGINCRDGGLPKEAGENAGALMGNFSRSKLAATLANEFLPMITHLEDGEYLEYYRSHSLVIGERIRIFRAIGTSPKDGDEAGGIPALALGISGNGGLIVRYDDGSEETLTTGEITIRKE